MLQGIWAAAPYLHNGSVPSLTELLKPAAERVATFKLGPTYDIATVGLAAEQTQFDYDLETTDCTTSIRATAAAATSTARDCRKRKGGAA